MTLDQLEQLQQLEQFYDAVPRSDARAEDFGPLTLFVREGPGWPFYARPALGHPGAATAADVDRVRARQRELSIPEAFEWVHETTPGLRKAIEESGLTVHAHPLMVLADDASVPEPSTSASVRVLGAQDPFLAAALTVPHPGAVRRILAGATTPGTAPRRVAEMPE
ncbi:hypothetical protein [Streptomyces sp. SYSU K21746]